MNEKTSFDATLDCAAIQIEKGETAEAEALLRGEFMTHFPDPKQDPRAFNRAVHEAARRLMDSHAQNVARRFDPDGGQAFRAGKAIAARPPSNWEVQQARAEIEEFNQGVARMFAGFLVPEPVIVMNPERLEA